MACLLGPLQPRLCLRSAAHRGFRKKNGPKKRPGEQEWGNGQAQRPGLRRSPGLAEFPARRPRLGLGFVSASAGVLLPGPSVVHAPFLFFFPAARWAAARPLRCSASQRPGGDEVGREGGRGRGGRPRCAGVGKKGLREAAETCSLHELGVPRPAEGGSCGGGGATRRPAAFTRPLKFVATVRAALTPGVLRA